MASKGVLCNVVNGFCTRLQSFGFPQGCVCLTFGHFYHFSFGIWVRAAEGCGTVTKNSRYQCVCKEKLLSQWMSGKLGRAKLDNLCSATYSYTVNYLKMGIAGMPRMTRASSK